MLVFFFASASLFAQSNDSNENFYKAFVNEKNIEKLPKLVLKLFKNPNDSLLQLSLNHVENIKNKGSLTQCDKVYLAITEARILQKKNKCDKAIALYKSIEKDVQVANCKEIKKQEIYSDLGANYNYTGKNTDALKAYYNALQFSTKDKDTLIMCIVNINIGNIYYVLRKFDKAKKCYEESIHFSGTNPKYLVQKGHAHDALGNLFLDSDSSMENAIYNFTKAIQIYERTKNKHYVYRSYNNLGIAYSLQGDNKTAFQYYQKVFDYASSINDHELLGNVCLDYSYSYLDLNEIDKAIFFSKKSYQHYGAMGMLDGMMNASQQLSQLYRKENNFEKAYEHQSAFMKYKDSLNVTSNAEKLMELKKDYEFGIEREHLNNEVLNYKLRNTILAISLICLALIGGLFYLVKKRKEQKRAAQIQEQFTFQLLQNTEEERSRIANELHDSVNHDLLTLKNNLTHGKTIQVEDVSQVIEEVRNISRNLHPAILETLGLEASIENLCERLTEVGLFTTCEIDYQHKLNKNKELQLYRIVQEALNNTLKHGKANAAKVIITSLENHLHLEIKDNGNGFNVNEQLNNPKSFGLQSILQRAKAIMAKINIDSSSSGTIILIKIPV